MGQSADATLIYGMGWGSEDAPPAWRDKWGDIRPEIQEQYEELTGEDYPGDWLEAVLEQTGTDDVLEICSVGYVDYSGWVVGLKNSRTWAFRYEPMDVTGAMDYKPNAREREALEKIAAVIGYEDHEIGWKLFPSYG